MRLSLFVDMPNQFSSAAPYQAFANNPIATFDATKAMIDQQLFLFLLFLLLFLLVFIFRLFLHRLFARRERTSFTTASFLLVFLATFVLAHV